MRKYQNLAKSTTTEASLSAAIPSVNQFLNEEYHIKLVKSNNNLLKSNDDKEVLAQ